MVGGSAARLASKSLPRLLTKQIGIVGAPTNKGQPKDGPQIAPRALRETGLIRQLESLHFDVKDYGDVQVQDDAGRGESTIKLSTESVKLKNPQTVARYSKQLSDKVSQCLKDERICLTLGGDHSLAIGSLHAHTKHNPNLSVLWIDAHGDINTEKTTMSGNIHGMVLSFFVRGIPQEYANSPQLTQLFGGIQPCLEPSSLCYIALRDIDPLERQLMDTLQIKYFTMGDVDRLGITETTAQALDLLSPSRSKPLHVSFDVDSIDPCFSPSTGTPVPGGLTLREALTLGEMVSSTNLLRCLDWVEVNPKAGGPKEVNKTLETSVNVLLSFLGIKQPDEAELQKPLHQSIDLKTALRVD